MTAGIVVSFHCDLESIAVLLLNGRIVVAGTCDARHVGHGVPCRSLLSHQSDRHLPVVVVVGHPGEGASCNQLVCGIVGQWSVRYPCGHCGNV